MSPTGIDSAPCTRSAPCATMGRAYRAAGPGDVVELAGGTYDAAAQNIPRDPSKRLGDPIIFRPAGGAAVTITGHVKVGAARIFFRDMRFAGGWMATGDRITFKNIDSTGMFILSGTNIRVLGGQVYPGPGYQTERDADPLLASATRGNPPTNILIDGVRFHGWLRPPGTDYHTECFQAGAGVNVVIRNSRFYDCATHDLFIQSWGGLNGANNRIDNWVLENNYLGATRDGYFAVQLLNRDDQSRPGARFLIRNNSWLQGIRIDLRDDATLNVVANVGLLEQNLCSQSKGEVVWSYNVFSAARCSATDTRAAPSFVDQDALDLRLKPDAKARGHGDPKSYPSTDILGVKRPVGPRPDAGAVEAK